MKSACQLLLHRTYKEIWQRGEKYADGGKIEVLGLNEKHIEADVHGINTYITKLEFHGNGIRKSCSCPYIESHSDQAICKHMVAVAIFWDEGRGIVRPSKESIEGLTIPPPEVSRLEIDDPFSNPLDADLDLLRILADETAFHGRPRPHARLPNMPSFNVDEKIPLTLKEVEKAFQQINKWSYRRNYDLYFCSGEMVAAYCEILRIVMKRVVATNPIVAVNIILEAQNFNRKLILEMIDDSNGLHEFSEAHLDAIYKILKKISMSRDGMQILEKKLNEFNKHRDDY